MADDPVKKSRRAQRRARKQSEDAEAPEDSAEEASSAGAPDEGEDGDDSAAEADASDAGEDDGGERDDPSSDDAAAEQKADSKRKKRRKKKAAAEPSEIRDRNRKVREQAARRRRARREKERSAAAQTGLDTSEMVDDAFVRTTDSIAKWLKANFRWVQWIVIASIAGAIGWQIYAWRTAKETAKDSDVLMAAVRAEQGRIGATEDEGKPDENGIVDPTPIFETHASRLETAAKRYREAMEAGKGTGRAVLAELGLAGVLYDQGDYEGALKAYESAEQSELAKSDPEIRGRALEGQGLALEAKGDTEGAAKAFRALANTDVDGFVTLGKVHEARVLMHADGDEENGKKEDAKKLLQEVLEKIKKKRGDDEGPPGPPSYVEQSARELLAQLDPAAAAADMPLAPGDMDPEVLEKLVEDLKKKQQQGGGSPEGKP